METFSSMGYGASVLKDKHEAATYIFSVCIEMDMMESTLVKLRYA